MLVIRKEQMAAFEEPALQAFEDRTYVHLLEYFPRHCELLGEAQVRRAIQYGWEKAQSYKLFAERCVRSYIDLMCVLGGEFDTDPLMPWAAEILQDRSISDEVDRGDRLYEKAWDYIHHIIQDYRDAAGAPTTARFVDELKLMRMANDQPLTATAWPTFASSLQARLLATFPAKCAYVGNERVAQAILHATAHAQRHGIDGERGIVLFAALRFVLGAGFDKDPLLPWAAEVLTDETITDQHKRTDRLLATGISFLRRWWDSAPGLEG